MGDNLVINDENVAKVIKVLKYVVLTFNGITPVQTSSQIPGDVIVVPTISAKFQGVINTYNVYNLLYNWLNGNSNITLLVPTVDTTYSPDWCILKVPVTTLQLVYNSTTGTQTQIPSYIINSEEPLYIKGVTIEGNTTRNVTIESSIIKNGTTYNHYLTLNIDGATVLAGSSKTFTVTLSFYKDRVFSKYLGSVNITVTITNSSGPGE